MELDKVSSHAQGTLQANDTHRSAGQLTLRGLRLKRGALDKFRLPVDVIEGWTTIPSSYAH